MNSTRSHAAVTAKIRFSFIIQCHGFLFCPRLVGHSATGKQSGNESNKSWMKWLNAVSTRPNVFENKGKVEWKSSKSLIKFKLQLIRPFYSTNLRLFSLSAFWSSRRSVQTDLEFFQQKKAKSLTQNACQLQTLHAEEDIKIKWILVGRTFLTFFQDTVVSELEKRSIFESSYSTSIHRQTPTQFAINPERSCVVSGLFGGVYKKFISLILFYRIHNNPTIMPRTLTVALQSEWETVTKRVPPCALYFRVTHPKRWSLFSAWNKLRNTMFFCCINRGKITDPFGEYLFERPIIANDFRMKCHEKLEDSMFLAQIFVIWESNSCCFRR